jgi:hypothetical protein
MGISGFGNGNRWDRPICQHRHNPARNVPPPGWRGELQHRLLLRQAFLQNNLTGPRIPPLNTINSRFQAGDVNLHSLFPIRLTSVNDDFLPTGRGVEQPEIDPIVALQAHHTDLRVRCLGLHGPQIGGRPRDVGKAMISGLSRISRVGRHCGSDNPNSPIKAGLAGACSRSQAALPRTASTSSP